MSQRDRAAWHFLAEIGIEPDRLLVQVSDGQWRFEEDVSQVWREIGMKEDEIVVRNDSTPTAIRFKLADGSSVELWRQALFLHTRNCRVYLKNGI